MIPSPLLAGFGLVTYQQPAIQLQISNPTSDTTLAYIGGAVMHPESTTEAGQLFSNPNFVQGLTYWIVNPSGGDSWTPVAGGVQTTLTFPTPSTADTLGQNFTGLSTNRQYRFEVVFEFVGAPFTGTLSTGVGGTSYIGAFGKQTFSVDYTPIVPNFGIGVVFQFQAPTALGASIILNSVRLLDYQNSEVEYYRMVQNGFTSRPVRMRNTRLLFSSSAQLNLPMYYVREEVTGHKQQDYIPLVLFKNPYYLPAYNILDMREPIYTLDGQNFLQFVLPPNSSLTWCADVVAEVQPKQ